MSMHSLGHTTPFRLILMDAHSLNMHVAGKWDAQVASILQTVCQNQCSHPSSKQFREVRTTILTNECAVGVRACVCWGESNGTYNRHQVIMSSKSYRLGCHD